ncbi:MAG: M20 family metallo-hydrolase [Clostridiales bacterium]|nr:M20 family metallo-hydrolase [Clostridiales bacterium]
MKINGQRLIDDLKNLREITATPGQGVTRFSYTEEDRRARDYLARVADVYGFRMETDAIGNIRIYPPESKGSTIIGSHIDTVRNGGWLDGIYGVMSGMEALRAFADHGAQTDAALMVYAEEEGSVFGSTMTGSKFLTGKYGKADLTTLKDEQGATLKEHLETCGYLSAGNDNTDFRMDFSSVRCALELHIEQGPVMDAEGLQIGIVDTVFGMHVLEITYSGLGNHAGASPMIGRRNPMSAFGEAAVVIEKAALEAGHGVVATIGKVVASPGGSNVIPDSVRFTVDIRSNDDARTNETVETIRSLAKEIASRRNIDCTIRDAADSSAIPFSRNVIDRMAELAEEQGINYRVMDSGAVHDTAMLAPYTEAGMIFVPSINGRSHVPEENTREEDLIRGAQFLKDFIEAFK